MPRSEWKTSPLELAFLTEANPVAQRLHRYAQHLGRHRHRLPALDQPHRLKLEFQSVFSPGLSVFSLAYFSFSKGSIGPSAMEYVFRGQDRSLVG